MNCGENIYDLATTIWEDIGYPTSPTASYISGWLVTDSNIGKLNNLISTSFSGSNGCIGPDFGDEEQAIYGEIYKQIYWIGQINSKLGAGGIQWIEMTEGDTKIRRASPTEEAKIYKDLYKESRLALKDLITAYKINASPPRSVDFAPP